MSWINDIQRKQDKRFVFPVRYSYPAPLSLGTKPSGTAGSHSLLLKKKSHGYSLSFGLNCSLISNTPSGTFSFAHTAQSPFVTFVSAHLLTTACVTDFCCHTPTLISMRRKNPTLCKYRIPSSCFDIYPRQWYSQLHSLHCISFIPSFGEPQ